MPVTLAGYDPTRARCTEFPPHLGCRGEVIVNRLAGAAQEPSVVTFSSRPVANGEARVVEGRVTGGARRAYVALASGASSRRNEYLVSAADLVPVVRRAIALVRLAEPGKRVAGAVPLHGGRVVVWARVSPRGERTITLANERPAARRRQGGSSTMDEVELALDEIDALERALDWIGDGRG